MQDVSSNIKYKICEYLNLLELINVLSTCKLWRKMYDFDNFWSYLTYTNFGYKIDKPKDIYLAVGLYSEIVGHDKIFSDDYKINFYDNIIIIEHIDLYDNTYHYISNINSHKCLDFDRSEQLYIILYIKENKKVLIYDGDGYYDNYFMLIDTINGKISTERHDCLRFGNNIINALDSGQYKYTDNCLLFDKFIFYLDTLTIINN